MVRGMSILRSVAALIVLRVCCGISAGVTPTPEFAEVLTPEERVYLNGLGELRVGVDPDLPPMSKRTGADSFAGMDIDLMEEVARRTGLRFKIVSGKDWDEVVAMSKRRDLDLVCSMSNTAERREWMVFSQPYRVSPVVYVTPKGGEFSLTPHRLKSLRVVGPKQSTTEKLSALYPEVNIRRVPSVGAALREVSEGRADVALGILTVVSAEIANGNLSDLKIAAITPVTFQGTFGARKDHPHLVGILDKGVRFVPEFERRAIVERWQTTEVPWSARIARGWQVVAVAFIGLGAVAIALLLTGRRRLEALLKLARQLRRHDDSLREKHIELERLNVALVRANEGLERRVEARARHLEQAIREMQAFAFSVTNDLRVPLSEVRSRSERLHEHCAARSDPESRHLLERILAAESGMSRLIDGIIRLTFVDKHEFRRERVNLSRIAGEIAAELRAGDPGRDATFEITSDMEVWGDPDMLRSVLLNLLSNAWKYSAKKARTRVVFADRRNSQGERVFFVKDSGAGFDPVFAEKLFRPFSRLHSDREFEGTGIGLATVRRIINRHGGVMGASGVQGEGAEFWFTLPSEGPEGGGV